MQSRLASELLMPLGKGISPQLEYTEVNRVFKKSAKSHTCPLNPNDQRKSPNYVVHRNKRTAARFKNVRHLILQRKHFVEVHTADEGHIYSSMRTQTGLLT
jgi:hypothetical protein